MKKYCCKCFAQSEAEYCYKCALIALEHASSTIKVYEQNWKNHQLVSDKRLDYIRELESQIKAIDDALPVHIELGLLRVENLNMAQTINELKTRIKELEELTNERK